MHIVWYISRINLYTPRVKEKMTMLAALRVTLRTQLQNKREIVLCTPVYCHIACCEKYLCFVSVTTRFLCVCKYVRSFSVLEILRVAVVVGICQSLCLVFSFTKTPYWKSTPQQPIQEIPTWKKIKCQHYCERIFQTRFVFVRNGNFFRHCF